MQDQSQSSVNAAIQASGQGPDQLSPFDEIGLQFAFDATTLKLIETCHYKYYLKIIEGWVPRNHSVHLIFGGHLAKAFERYYKFRADGLDKQDSLREVVRQALIDTWEPLVCPDCHGRGNIPLTEEEARKAFPGHSPGAIQWANVDCVTCETKGSIWEKGKPWDSLDDKKNRETLIRTIVWYFDQFENEDIAVVLQNGRPAVEHTFALPVDNGYVFCGHIDRLVNYAGDLYVMDQKTTGGTIGPWWFAQFTPDTQISMYTYAGKVIYSLPVQGVMIDGIQIAVGFSRFERGFAHRSDGQLAEWYDDTMRNIEEIRKATKENYFVHRTTSCHMYNGCEYRSICSRSPEVRKNFLTGDYERKPRWNPLQAR